MCYVGVESVCGKESVRLRDNLSICSKQVMNHFRTSRCVPCDPGGALSVPVDGRMGMIVARKPSTELANGEIADVIDGAFWGAYSVATTSSSATRMV